MFVDNLCVLDDPLPENGMNIEISGTKCMPEAVYH